MRTNTSNASTNNEELTIDRANSAKMFMRKRRGCPICSSDSSDSPAENDIDYKNPEALKKYISEGGRMLPSRITNVCAKHQRILKNAIKRSRLIALLPFVYKLSK